MVQETWLDASHGQIFIPNYKVVSRRDRKNETNRGGILTLSRNDFNDLVHIEDANEEERSWHYLHIDPEVILLANWYRPGSTTHDGFESYTADLQRLCSEATGIIVTGDLNIHHERWLRYSNANTSIGADLRIISENFGMHQIVREPTRENYLLDLFLTDIADTKIEVGPKIADHKFLFAQIPFPELSSLNICRKRFNLRRAKWKDLKDALKNFTWDPLRQGSADDAAAFFLDALWTLLCTFIPYEEVILQQRSHPWLNKRCEEAIKAKNAAELSPNFNEIRNQCKAILNEEYHKYVKKLKDRISNLQKGSKEWWRLNRELFQKKTKCSSIPPLRDGEVWINGSKEKADLFAKTFLEKSKFLMNLWIVSMLVGQISNWTTSLLFEHDIPRNCLVN